MKLGAHRPDKSGGSQVADGIAVTGSDGIVQFVAAGSTALTGYPAEDAVGKHLTVFVRAELQADLESANDRREQPCLEFAARRLCPPQGRPIQTIVILSSPIGI